ncbi:hypothetical protein WN55_07351 [Dufourea novaeangliae]|uniref:CCHC-type domain-containing protein n=1 Tax=Dufourea novaeangliae TaxID=178035 RepID=A0A154PRY3_DUFNO|nr:hypothetical protein WN55_07351 [Dufourea novaeangliae]
MDINYFQKLMLQTRQIDKGIESLVEIWNRPHVFIGRFAECSEETNFHIEAIWNNIKNAQDGIEQISLKVDERIEDVAIEQLLQETRKEYESLKEQCDNIELVLEKYGYHHNQDNTLDETNISTSKESNQCTLQEITEVTEVEFTSNLSWKHEIKQKEQLMTVPDVSNESISVTTPSAKRSKKRFQRHWFDADESLKAWLEEVVTDGGARLDRVFAARGDTSVSSAAANFGEVGGPGLVKSTYTTSTWCPLGPLAASAVKGANGVSGALGSPGAGAGAVVERAAPVSLSDDREEPAVDHQAAGVLNTTGDERRGEKKGDPPSEALPGPSGPAASRAGKAPIVRLQRLAGTEGSTSASARGGRCYVCGGTGHVARDCQESPRCPVCSDLGRPAGHRLGGRDCAPPPSRRRKRRGTAATPPGAAAATQPQESQPAPVAPAERREGGSGPGEAMDTA